MGGLHKGENIRRQASLGLSWRLPTTKSKYMLSILIAIHEKCLDFESRSGHKVSSENLSHFFKLLDFWFSCLVKQYNHTNLTRVLGKSNDDLQGRCYEVMAEGCHRQSPIKRESSTYWNLLSASKMYTSASSREGGQKALLDIWYWFLSYISLKMLYSSSSSSILSQWLPLISIPLSLLAAEAFKMGHCLVERHTIYNQVLINSPILKQVFWKHRC